MKAAIYARVSSEMQIDNFSIAAQLNELENYCLKNNIEIFKKYIDEGYSSKNDKRPGFKRMIQDSENKCFDMILVHEYSRFASNYELSKSLEDKLKKNNITVISITEKIDNSPSGFFQKLIMQGLAEWRLLNLAQHVKKSQRYMVAEKGLNHGASVYGYNMIDKKLVINEDEARIIKLIYEKYLSGVGIQKIIRYLLDNNIYTRKGKIFEAPTIRRILKNPKYIGKLQYNNEIYKGEHQAIISKEIFGRVQRELRERRCCNYINHDGPIISRRSERWYNYYLLTILYCGKCGANMRITQSGNKQVKYYCCGRALRYTGACDCTKLYRVEKIEHEIECILKEFLDGIINFVPKINTDNTRDILERRLDKIPAEISRVQDGFLAGIFSIAEAKEKKLQLENEKVQIEIELKNMGEHKFDIEDPKENLLSIWDTFIFTDDICQKREILKSVVEKIYIDKNGIMEIVFVDKRAL